MSRRIKRQKENASNILKITAGLILSIGSLFWMVFHTGKNMQIESATRRPDTLYTGAASAKSEEAILICSILQKIENNFKSEFIEEIYSMQNNVTIAHGVKSYLLNFADTCVKHDAKDKKMELVSSSYFVSNVFPLKDFLIQNGLNEGDALSYCEIIPYYCIKFYEQDNNKNQTWKNPLNMELYNNYIKIFATTHKKLSEKSADVICLYLNASYDCLKKKEKNSLKRIQESVKKFQSDFESEIGENGIYERQRNYLKSILDSLDKKINRWFPSLGYFEEYKIPTAK